MEGGSRRHGKGGTVVGAQEKAGIQAGRQAGTQKVVDQEILVSAHGRKSPRRQASTPDTPMHAFPPDAVFSIRSVFQENDSADPLSHLILSLPLPFFLFSAPALCNTEVIS